MNKDWATSAGESDRLHILRQYGLSEQANLDSLNRIAKLAAKICNAPIALVSIVSQDRQTFVGAYGINAAGTPRSQSFCSIAMHGQEPMTVPCAPDDARFSANPLVTGDPNIRFYCGVPLRSAEGAPLGSLCIIDDQPRAELAPDELEALSTLAGAAMAVLEQERIALLAKRESERSATRISELENRFESLADVLPQMVWSADNQGYADYFNRRWAEYTGASAQASFGAHWLEFIHEDDRAHTQQAWSDAITQGTDYEARYRLRNASGEYRWVLARGLPIRGQQQIMRWIGTSTDIQDEAEAAEQLEVFSQELSHRIKNIFAVISGLISLSSRKFPELSTMAAELNQRVIALSSAHDLVRPRSFTEQGSRKDVTLVAILEELLAAYRAEDFSRIHIRGGDVMIDDRSATPLALYIHELATNAAKYGALCADGGRIDIDIAAGDQVAMTWQESGGPPVHQPAERGFGLDLADVTITRQLGGELEYDWDPAGLTVTATIPAKNLYRN